MLTVFAWIFFRAENVSHAYSYIKGIFSKSLFSIPDFSGKKNAAITLILVLIFLLVEWLGRNDKFAIENFGLNWKRFYRYCFYFLIILIIFLFNETKKEFIYFQF